MPALINWDLLKQPYNWIIVFVMCVFALIFLSFVFPQATNSET
jgi:hypothetical protein